MKITKVSIDVGEERRKYFSILPEIHAPFLFFVFYMEISEPIHLWPYNESILRKAKYTYFSVLSINL